MTARGVVRFPRSIPKTVREWERIFDPLNEVVKETPEGVEVEADNVPSTDSPYVTVGAVSDLPSARPLTSKEGQTIINDTGTTVEVELASAGVAGTYTKVVTDSKGRVVAGAELQTSDMPATLQMIHSGFGDPNGVVTAPPGSLYLNKSGGAGVTLWVKQSGSGNVGWDGK